MGGQRDMAWLWEWDPTTCTINKPNREAEPLVVKFRNKIWKSEPLAVLLTFIGFVMDWMWFFRFRRGSFPRKDQLLVVLKSACLKIHLNDASFSQENAFTRQTRQLPLDRRDNSATKVQKEFLFLNIQIFTTPNGRKVAFVETWENYRQVFLRALFGKVRKVNFVLTTCSNCVVSTCRWCSVNNFFNRPISLQALKLGRTNYN